nr:uncharacterized protein LOC123768942 isoform X2 [Procambarus clarkii]
MLINEYTPTMTNPDDIKEKFYEELCNLIVAVPGTLSTTCHRIDWSHKLSRSQNYTNSELNNHRFSMTKSIDSKDLNENGSKDVLISRDIKKLEQVYETIIRKMEKKAITSGTSRMLYRISAALTEQKVSGSDTVTSMSVDNTHADLSTVTQLDSKISTLKSNSSNSVPMYDLLENNGNESFPKDMFCGFCKSNGEMPQTYLNHYLRDRRGVLTCDALRHYTCPRCGETGDNAHTASYCPLAMINDSSPLATKLKKTKRNATVARGCLPLRDLCSDQRMEQC